MGTLLAFIIVCVGVIVLRRTQPDAPRPFRVPYCPYLPAAGVLVCLVQMMFLPWQTWLRLLVWLVLGMIWYAGGDTAFTLWGRWRGQTGLN